MAFISSLIAGVLMLGLSSCSFSYDPDSSITVKAAASSQTPTRYLFTLSTAQGGIRIQEEQSDARTGEAVFSAVLPGRYVASAYAYLGEHVAAQGSVEVEVSAGSDSRHVIELVPTADPGATGTLVVSTGFSGVDSVDALIIVDTEDNILHREEGPFEAGAISFTAEVESFTEATLRLGFILDGGIIGYSEALPLSLATGSEVAFSPIGTVLSKPEKIEDLRLAYNGFSLDSLAYSFTLPSFDYEQVVIEWSDDQASHRTILDKESIEASAEDGTFTGVITGLKEGTSVSIKAWTVKDAAITGLVSEAGPFLSPVSLKSLRIQLPDEVESIQPGGSVALGILTSPANASDFGGSWTSSAPSTASVDKQGNLRVHGFGTVTLSYLANNGRLRASQTLTITLSPPDIKTTLTEEGVLVSWTGPSSADYFELSRADGSLLARIERGEDYSFLDKDVSAGGAVRYRLTAYHEATGSSSSVLSEEITIPPASIEISIEEPEDLPIVMEGILDGLVLGRDEEVTITFQPIEGITAVEWMLNGSVISTADTVTISGSDPHHIFDTEAGVQQLVLVLTDSRGQRHSGFATYRIEVGQ